MPKFSQLVADTLLELNNVRTDPQRFANRMEDALQQYQNNTWYRHYCQPVATREGTKAVEEAIEWLKEKESLGSLEWRDGLAFAGQELVNHQGPRGKTDHETEEGQELQDRLELFGQWSESVAEGLDFGAMSGFEVVYKLLVDDGLEHRPHRKAIMNPIYNQVGVAAGPHEEFITMVSVILSHDFQEKEDLEKVKPLKSRYRYFFEFGDWLPGAVKAHAEVKTQSKGNKVFKNYKITWEMRDGSTQTTRHNVELD